MNNPYFNIDAGQITPTLDCVLVDANLAPVNLQGATVRFSLYQHGGAVIFLNRNSTIVSANQGKVRYAWQFGDTDTAGEYLGRFTVTYVDSELQDFPDERYIEITVT